MPKKGFCHIVVCLSLLFFLELPAHAFSQVFIFGDSLEDTGNLAALGGSPFPAPYFMNRITNGPLAVDVLAEGLGLSAEASLHLIGPAVGTNYAVASARAHTAGLIDLTTQVGAFLLNNGGLAPSDALYVVGIGGNDIRDARDAPNKMKAKQIMARAIEMTGMNLRRLAAAGATSIIVLNLPDVGALPETTLISKMSGNRALVKKTTQKSKRFNKGLSRQVRQIEIELGMDLIEFDTFTFFKHILANGPALGFNNTSDACFSSVTFTFHPDCLLGKQFDEFVYFDEIHPTAKVHALWGNALLEIVPSQNHP